MEGNKRNQFTVEIRRKNIQSRIQAMRSIYFADDMAKVTNQHELIDQIMKGEIKLVEKLNELKVLSYNQEYTQKFIDSGILTEIFAIVIEVELSDAQYNDIMNILINLCAYAVINIPNLAIQKIVMSFLNKNRQILSLWLTANIIYQKTEYSSSMSHELMTSCDVLNYLEKRLTQKFERQSDIVILNFFCCSFLVVSGEFAYQHYTRLLKIIETIMSIPQLQEQNFWYFTEAMIEHGFYIGNNKYQIFSTKTFQKYHSACRLKKTKLIRNYLKMLINFTAIDLNSYEKMLKYEVFMDLSYCSENRFPEIKKLSAEIGINLIKNQRKKIDIENIHYFHELSCEFVNFQKYDLPTQIALLDFSRLFYGLMIQNLFGDAKQDFIDGLCNTKVFESLCLLTTTSNSNSDIIMNCLDIFRTLMKIDKNNKIKTICSQNSLQNYLSYQVFQNQELSTFVEKFLAFYEKSK